MRNRRFVFVHDTLISPLKPKAFTPSEARTRQRTFVIGLETTFSGYFVRGSRTHKCSKYHRRYYNRFYDEHSFATVGRICCLRFQCSRLVFFNASGQSDGVSAMKQLSKNDIVCRRRKQKPKPLFRR